MRLTRNSILFLAFIATALCAMQQSTRITDSLFADTTVATTAEADAKEQASQDDFNELFSFDSGSIDTTFWNNTRINAGRFDYKQFNDTLYLTLSDSAKGKRYVHPTLGRITSHFGARHSMWHYGTDIKVRVGDTIRCAFDGIVRVIQLDKHGYGKVVVIRHPDGLETLYGHLSKTLVECNQRIVAGEVLGLGGNTGRSTGSHLHFEMRFRGEPFNPEDHIDFETGCLKSNTLMLSQSDFTYLGEARATVYHVVRRGQTLGRIARIHGTSIRKLCALNGLRPRTVLAVGRRIIIRKNTLGEPQLTYNAKIDTKKRAF
jgi:hypothetical protein